LNNGNYYVLGGIRLERRYSLLFGIIGGFFLAQINGIFQLQMAFGSVNGSVTDVIFRILSIIGLICIIYFSILLIIDTIKTVHKK
jgi:hypothetical protein